MTMMSESTAAIVRREQPGIEVGHPAAKRLEET